MRKKTLRFTKVFTCFGLYLLLEDLIRRSIGFMDIDIIQSIIGRQSVFEHYYNLPLASFSGNCQGELLQGRPVT